MLQSKAFVKKTRKGKVLKVVREHYLRDDIWSGSPLDAECDQDAVKLSASAAHYLIVDTNIVLQQVMLMSSMCATLCTEQPGLSSSQACTSVLNTPAAPSARTLRTMVAAHTCAKHTSNTTCS